MKTQQEKIVTFMVQNGNGWYKPQDFMQEQLGELFVGYEASARLSELAKDYPYMIDSKQDGKYKARRIRFENIDEWLDRLPDNLSKIFKENKV